MRTTKLAVLGLLLLPLLASAGKKDELAKVITSASNGAQCISPIHVRKIDGREKKVQRMGFNLEPGKHTLSGSALINTSFCSTLGRGTNNYNVPPVEAEFEAGKTYYVGINHKSPNRKEWEYVVWKVTDTK